MNPYLEFIGTLQNSGFCMVQVNLPGNDPSTEAHKVCTLKTLTLWQSSILGIVAGVLFPACRCYSFLQPLPGFVADRKKATFAP